MNPTLAVEIWVWDAIAYDYNVKGTPFSTFQDNHYGRYIWVYVFAPYAAAILAGLLSRVHFSNLQENSVRPEGKVTEAS